jgi:hypothetical protein
MPDVQSIEICDWLIQHTPELRIETAGQSRLVSSGLHLASRFAADLESGQIFDYLPESMFPRVINRFDFARTLVLDKWTCNSDGRQAVFAQHAPGRAGYVATFIDQGYCFNAGEWNFPDVALYGVYSSNHVYAAVASWDSFEPALTTAEEMDINEIWDCAAGIPQEWCGSDPGALPQLVEELLRRRSKIRDLITAFRLSSRNPFSNWLRH